MQIQLSEIPDEGLELQVNDTSWFPEDEIHRTGDLKARVFLERRRERLIAHGTINLIFMVDCDRCLKEYALPQTVEFSLVLEPEERVVEITAKDHQCDGNDMDVEYFSGTALDIGSILEQQVYLAYPAKRLCSNDCAGLCESCGANLNCESCGCPEKPVGSPFDILAQLKNK